MGLSPSTGRVVMLSTSSKVRTFRILPSSKPSGKNHHLLGHTQVEMPIVYKPNPPAIKPPPVKHYTLKPKPGTCNFDGCGHQRSRGCFTCRDHTCSEAGCTAPTFNIYCQKHTFDKIPRIKPALREQVIGF